MPLLWAGTISVRVRKTGLGWDVAQSVEACLHAQLQLHLHQRVSNAAMHTWNLSAGEVEAGEWRVPVIASYIVSSMQAQDT